MVAKFAAREPCWWVDKVKEQGRTARKQYLPVMPLRRGEAESTEWPQATRGRDVGSPRPHGDRSEFFWV